MMSERIVVTNTAIIINNYHLGDSEELERFFKVFDPITHSFLLFGVYYDEESQRLYCPSGCDLWFIQKCLGEKYFKRIEENQPQSTGQIMLKYPPRDDQQKEALSFMCGQGEYTANKNYHQMSVSLSTGKGKTYCSIATMCYYRLRSIVITGSSTLLSQWESEIIKYTNIKRQEVLMITGSDMILMILAGRSKKASEAKIFLCTHKTLQSFGDQYGWNRLSELFDYLGIGLKFFDEAHTNYENMLMIDFFTNTYKTFYVTATLARSNKCENRIFQISLKNVPNIDLFDENNDPHTEYVAIKWNSKPTPQDLTYCRNPKYGIDRNHYIDYVTKNERFYKMVRVIMEMVFKCKGRVLIYIGTNEGILRVYKWLGENYPELVGKIGIFTSLLSKEEKLRERDKQILLSTTKSAGVGEDIKHLKMTIVLAEPFRSEVLARQTLGRTRDSNTIYVELVDMGFKHLRNFYYAKQPVFQKYATKTSDYFMDNYELSRRAEKIEDSRDYIEECPIIINDPRFEFESKPEDDDDIEKPIEFHKKSKLKELIDGEG